MKKLTINTFSDSSHSWGKVKIELLKQLGIEDKISAFSYMRGEYAYLEEDSDLSLCIFALKSKNVDYKFKESYTNRRSKIRSYSYYVNNQ